MTDEAAEFWREFEAETGEKVEVRGMGQWFEADDDERGLWGLMILTDKSFRFKYMPSENWIASLFKAGNRRGAASKPFDVVIPRECLVSVQKPARSLMSRLFGQAYEPRLLTWRVADGEKSVRIGLEPKSELTRALEGALPGPAGA